jgi:D-alanyl-D-alanine carboxypeptidase/D-alanyl-D-alanine-endopeptidase (penicillin-binding protein 4)
LHPDFKQQKVFNFLSNKDNIIYSTQQFSNAYGKGWAWDDYLDDYMVQRSEFPMYGNLIHVYNHDGNITLIPKNIPVTITKEAMNGIRAGYTISRKWDSNDLALPEASTPSLKGYYEIPMIASWNEVPVFLQDTLHQKVGLAVQKINDGSFKNNDVRAGKIYSQPTDSMFRPMMYNSDNFFAEQTLLMAGNEHLGYMSDEAMIDTLLKKDLKDIPQKPQWVDGSGLSRYNLFSPQSFVFLLNKMRNEFGMERLKVILPTGGKGTIKNYYLKDSSFIYAKTGSLSNVIAFSGFLYTQKGKLVIFSVLANQFQGSATKVRRSVEKFLEGVRENY